MATYLILNIIVIFLVCIGGRIGPRKPIKAVVATLCVLFALSIVFDNLIVGFSIVDYDPQKILGFKIGSAPLEDFMYTIVAVLIIPIIWRRLGVKHAK